MKKLSMEELHRVSAEEFHKQDKTPLIVILDNVRSMNNVGSIFRTCDGFAVEKLYLCGITACPPNKEIAKTALGATESVEWKHATESVDWEYAEDTATLVQRLKAEGVDVYALEQTDSSIMLDQFQPTAGKKTAIIAGNELFGVNDSVLPYCNGAIEIPQKGTKHSFNVSIATGIVIWHIFNILQKY